LNLLFQFPQMLGINQIAWEDAYNWKITNEIIMFRSWAFSLQKNSYSNLLNIFAWMMKRLFMNIESIECNLCSHFVLLPTMTCLSCNYLFSSTR
jgi:hypothetical protein